MAKHPIKDKEILSILQDYHLFIDSDKCVDMPFYVDKKDINHTTSLKGESKLSATNPLGNTILECEMKEKNEYKYTFRILSDAIHSKLLFRLDEGDYTHWNRHLPIPVDQQQVPTPHFHKVGDDGIMFAYRTPTLQRMPSPLNIYDGFLAFCEECHIKSEQIKLVVHEEGTLPLQYEPDADPLKGIQFP